MRLVPLTVNIRMLMDCETIPDPHLRLETSGTVVIASQGTKPCGDKLVVPRTSKGKFENTQNTQAGSHEMVATEVTRKAVQPAATAGLPEAGTSEAVEITLKIILVRSEVINRDEYHSEELSSKEDIPEEVMTKQGSSEVIKRDNYHSEEFRSEEDIPEEIMIKHESSEVTNRDDYDSEEVSSEEDIPEEISVEHNYSEHSSREDDIPYEGGFEDDVHDVVIGAEEIETPDDASERDDIPEEIVTEGDASENVVDNKNDIIADEVREESIRDSCTEAGEVIEGAIYENEGCLDNFAIECQRISMINIRDVFL